MSDKALAENKVSAADVQQVADLAQLELTGEERTRMVRDLNAIMEHVNKLQAVDTSGIEPMAEGRVAGPVLRDDETHTCLPREEALRNAPDTDRVFFRVPKVIERG